ncbi:hypothetical protein [Bacillus sp. Marseille-Q1617]|uniref:hypothetical protein n=1 Tax=Bacillus sp. Marseille-Q1617 TaxID=2736887 RepID=UPI00158BBACA|nr:hypothetical protein [Bacillus sp. Marseille-Q1617]
MKKMLFGSLLLGGLLLAGNSASANEPEFTVKQTDSSLNVHIHEKADYYKVYNKGELIYEGTSPDWKDSIQEDFNKYKVGIYENNKLEKVVNVKVDNQKADQTKSTKSIMYNQQNSLKEDVMSKKVSGNTLENIATSEEVKLKWASLPDDDGLYEIYKDGKKIGQTKNLTFTDRNVKPGERYSYKVISETEVDQEQKNLINEQIGQEKLKEFNPRQLREMYAVKGSLTNIVKTPENTESYLVEKEALIKTPESESGNNLLKAASFPGTSDWRNYIFRYTTFIPQDSVEDPKPFNGTYLKGDGRGYNYFSNSYRTRVDVNAYLTWNDFFYNKDVGESHRCSDSACTDIIESDTASESGIEVLEDYSSSSKMQWRVKHDVGIPFGAEYPNITYYYDATLTSSPSLSINGSHDKAPSHEFYMAVYASDVMVPLEKYMVDSEWDFIMLAPGMPQEYFNISM